MGKGRFGARVTMIAASVVFALTAAAMAAQAMELKDGWQLQSACKVEADGAAISTSGYRPSGWYGTRVPSTVIAAQVAAGEFKDPYVGLNLRSIPGTTYPIGGLFADLEMPQDSPYRCGWWYRKSFTVPIADKGREQWLKFGGINYSAEIWVNGQRIADRSQVAGAYRTYEFNVTKSLKLGKENVIAVVTYAPTPTDLGINWVDWNPCPADKDMGLWGGVELVTSGPVTVRSPMVTTHFTDANLEAANLTVEAIVTNSSDHAVEGRVDATAAGAHVLQAVELAAGESRTVVFSPEQYAQLKVQHPRVWWPMQMGDHPLEEARVRFELKDGKSSDEQTVRFGIREVTSELTERGYRLFKVNGRPLLIRGGGWSPDMLLRQDPMRLREEFRMVRDMRLNTIRLEGKLESEDFFRLADEQGILVMAGWCCCDHWEHWDKWAPGTLEVATASLRSQVLRIRSHASLLMWLNGSDGPPPANVESAYLAVLKETHWPNPVLSSASQAATTVTGKSGVKMTGPYDYVAPSYWLTDVKYGGAYGFNTETSPGPAIPREASLEKMLSKDHLWPQDDVWAFHAGGGEFKNVTVFNGAMQATYGDVKDGVAYNRIAQTMAFDGERAMFEAYSRNKYDSTGVIQWMLNNAWPSTIWHLFDYYLDTGGGYFGTKKACEPLHVQYSYNDHSIYVVNSLYKATDEYSVEAKVFDVNLRPLFEKETTAKSDADSAVKVIDIPAEVFQQGQQVYFVWLELKSASGVVVSRNFYWVPEKLTEFDWAKTDFTHTPAKTPEVMTALRDLPEAKVRMTASVLDEAGKASLIRVKLANSSKALAFQLAVDAKDAKGEHIASLLWSDDYIELMPGEERELTAELPGAAMSKGPVSVELSGWNVKTVIASAGAEKKTIAVKSGGMR